MMKRGNPRSGLVGGAKPGCKAAAIEPPCSDAYTNNYVESRCIRRTKYFATYTPYPIIFIIFCACCTASWRCATPSFWYRLRM
ncbi:hypothetical protein DVH07_10830 [Hafnia paralvei]|nr:hypothetical protein DU449_10290 [Hafnia paralvei]RDA67542.1 hypothetical protein DVH08_12835 [Hafnia paralvei]RDA68286.1 hypothetical protein DVH09_10580 [Hafnia paralvei]RDA78037.1 hypothetical protein DVH10_10765 [Hafnia paralvei]RDA78579.1 hypothetical protein DVH07_10830 [Hafnia paralvei]